LQSKFGLENAKLNNLIEEMHSIQVNKTLTIYSLRKRWRTLKK
jgi:hypothetical protein